MEIEAHIDANGRRQQRQLDARAESRRRPQLRQIQLTCLRVNVADIEERDRLQRPRHVDTQLRVHDDNGITAGGKSWGGNRLGSPKAIEREATDGSVTTGKEPLAGRK